MSATDTWLMIGALICALISFRNWRGLMWIGIGAVSYITATLAWRWNLPRADAITALGDAGVCIAIYFVGKYRWEMWIWRLFQISVAISIIYLASRLGITSRIDHELYAIALEAVNWLVLLSIGGPVAFQWLARLIGAALQRMGISSHGMARSASRNLRSLGAAVWTERKIPPFSGRA